MNNEAEHIQESIKIWDPIIRIFHWLLVSCFMIAYITEEDFIFIHTYSGYIILFLLSIRIFWGLLGSKHARFSDFLYSPKEIIKFLKDTLQLKAPRYLGHNPAGGAMVFILLISLVICTMSGLMVYGIEDNSGPLASWLSGFSYDHHFWGEVVEEVHEFFANFILFLVIIHIAGVIVESRIHQENLVKAMITGNKVSNVEGRK